VIKTKEDFFQSVERLRNRILGEPKSDLRNRCLDKLDILSEIAASLGNNDFRLFTRKYSYYDSFFFYQDEVIFEIESFEFDLDKFIEVISHFRKDVFDARRSSGEDISKYSEEIEYLRSKLVDL